MKYFMIPIIIVAGFCLIAWYKDLIKLSEAISLTFAGSALILSGWIAWYVHFKPANVVGSISYGILWQFSSNSDGKITSQVFAPSFWLSNVGARPILIDDIRLRFKTGKDEEIYAYPTESIPLKAIEKSSQFAEYGLLHLGGPFRGFSLTHSEVWTSSYSYSIPKDFYTKLIGSVNIFIEIKAQGKDKWIKRIEDTLEFGDSPIHLQPFPKSAGVKIISIYTNRWKDRKK